MGRGGWPALVALVAFASAAAIGAGCERIVQWEDPGNSGDGGDGGQDGGDDGGADGGDAGNLGDGGTGAYLASFGPGGQFIRAPADGGATYPNVLTVGILRDGESGPVQIDISSSDASVASVAGGSVIVPGGTNSASVPVTSVAGGTATLTATFDGGVLQATVTALPRLLISEVAAANGLTADDEYVELYNPTPVDFSLAGYVVQYHSNSGGTPYLNVCVIPTGKHIAPFSFFLVGVNSFSRPEDTHDTWAGAGAFSASVGTVRLGAPGIGTGTGDALTLDRVGWGSGAVDPEGSSVDTSLLVTWGAIERKATASSTSSTLSGSEHLSGNAYDTDNNANDWVTKGSQEPQTSLSPAETPP